MAAPYLNRMAEKMGFREAGASPPEHHFSHLRSGRRRCLLVAMIARKAEPSRIGRRLTPKTYTYGSRPAHTYVHGVGVNDFVDWVFLERPGSGSLPTTLKLKIVQGGPPSVLRRRRKIWPLYDSELQRRIVKGGERFDVSTRRRADPGRPPTTHHRIFRTEMINMLKMILRQMAPQ